MDMVASRVSVLGSNAVTAEAEESLAKSTHLASRACVWKIAAAGVKVTVGSRDENAHHRSQAMFRPDKADLQETMAHPLRILVPATSLGILRKVLPQASQAQF
eukprot:TRINITY_DN5792_c0_g1_i1.p2 TRINITY_DN5792_c0_g1~~TRINITY_DN5792_c0_g1_i1.p2  ORF type:complete len:103 (+),score=19.20 TRINITY_DN5792_c0_g1_i1:171-479(+)